MQIMRGKIIRMEFVTRSIVKKNPETIFVYGDNMEGRGLKGQAAAMRGEPNTIGVPTKWRPDMREESFFTNEDWHNADVRHAIRGAFIRIEEHLSNGHDVVIPSAGLGTGLAQLEMRAPKIHEFIEASIFALEG